MLGIAIDAFSFFLRHLAGYTTAAAGGEAAAERQAVLGEDGAERARLPSGAVPVSP